MSLAYTLLAFIAAIGPLIVVHELGHYWVTRLCGIKVQRFSIGFGKPLLMRRFGPDQTEWCVAAFPLGGYVKMVDEREGEVAPSDLPRAFNRQSVWKRFAVVAAGPVANFLMAIFLYWLLFMHGVPELRAIVAEPLAESSAARAGFVSGDAIVKFGDKDVVSWNDVRWQLLQLGTAASSVKIETVNEKGQITSRTLDLTPLIGVDLDNDLMGRLGLKPFRPFIPAVFGRVIKDGIAEQAGLAVGDLVLAVNDKPTVDWDAFVSIIRANPERAVRIAFDRDGRRQEVVVTPRGDIEEGRKIGRIDVGSQKIDPQLAGKLIVESSYPVFGALAKSLEKTWDTSVFSLEMLGKMVIGKVSLKNLSGVITIADYAGQTAQLGWVPFFGFLALISISLGLLNLLPIPLLDGGHLMYYIVEIIRGNPVSDRTMELGQRLGFGFLMVLMAIALYNDITRLVITRFISG